MIHSSSETTSTSPTAISPFSTYSRLSEATSDGQRRPLSTAYPLLTHSSSLSCTTCAHAPIREHPRHVPAFPPIRASYPHNDTTWIPTTGPIEAPDLGAFNSVFREFQQLQTGPPRILQTTVSGIELHVDPDHDGDPESASPRSALLSALTTDSEANAGSTVWTQRIIASYFDPSVVSAQTRSAVDDRSRGATTTDEDADTAARRVHRRLSPSLGVGEEEDGLGGDGDSDSETEGESDPHVLTVRGSFASDAGVDGGVDGDEEHPTLGTIDSVMEFLMSERDRVQAGRSTERRMVQHYSSTSDGGIGQSQDADMRRSRKRRRKKPIKTIQILRRDAPETVSVSETTVHADDTGGDADRDDADADVHETEGDSSSSLDGAHHYKSTPSTPPETNRVLVKRDALKHSKSTPTLKVRTIPPDPQILKLRCLAHKLRLRFPEDYERITALLTQDFSGGESDFSDPRGPAPRARDTLIHVFIDHSNILIGLLTYHKKHRSLSRRLKRLSHAALALLLERGRPITRRCLVTSSPLYQPMDSAIQLGYDVRIYARVPDNGDAPDRRQPHPPDSASSRKANWRKSDTSLASASLSPSSKTHVRGHSTGNASTDSDRATTHATTTGTASTTRIRYREQGVDELLQLKLHQAIAATDPPPPNATIVLATGDGNVGQFNEEGFLGPARLALQRGWKIELYAWQEGLSRAWKKLSSEGPWKERFRIIRMEDFAEDLLEVEVEGR